jgi:uncharacterized protein YyaL (SSP411 family)
VLADWNGLTIAALAEASPRLGRPDWLALAQRAFAWIVEHLGQGDRLHHSWRDGRRLPQAFLDDYAAMSLAAIGLYERTGHAPYLEQAGRWLDVLDADYADPAGGYFTTSSDADDLVVRVKAGQDGPVPSGNALALQALARLAVLTGDAGLERRAQGILGTFAGEIRRVPSAFAGILAGAALLAEPVQLVVVGEPGRAELLSTVAMVPVANLVLNPVVDTSGLSSEHPAAGKPMVGGRATAYICLGRTCQAPVTEPEALRRALAGIAGMGTAEAGEAGGKSA